MSQPTQYTPTTDFSQQEANNASGRSTVNTAALDAEFANIETTVDDICDNLALIQRDDGKLKDLTVMLHTLSPEVLNLMGGFNLRGLWSSATNYAVNDIASNTEYTYVCITAHTSGGSFDPQYWIQFGFTGGADAAQAAANAQVSANSALNSASTATTQATNASNAASNALAYAGNAESSSSAASVSESNAGNSATSASNSAAAAAASAATLPNATTAGADKFLKTNSGGNSWEYQTASQARGSLGLVIGTNVQAYSAGIATASSTQLEMEAGTESALRSMSPLRVAQAVYSLAKQIQPVSASVAANTLTIAASALSLDFRSTTLGSGTVTRVAGTPSNLVISSGSTLGTVSGQQSDIAVLALNNAGTIELAAVNVAGGANLDETGLITTIAEGGAGSADSATVAYSTTARSNLAYRVIGIIRSTQATAGTWATSPALVQGVGGQAFSSMQSIGYGQSWVDVKTTPGRSLGTTYYNTTGRPRAVSVSIGGTATVTATVNGVVAQAADATASVNASINFIVPPGHSYVVSGGSAVSRWAELG